MVVLKKFQNASEAAQALAAAVANNLVELLVQQERVTLAVSGGRSPIAFFQALSDQELDWTRVNISLVDERIVPTDHADSNTGLIRRYLLQNKAVAAHFIPMIADNTDVKQLLNIEQTVKFAIQNYQQPDVLVLGMGNDGHTASLFAQAPQLADGLNADYSQPLLHTTPITAPHERISMTLNAIEQARYVYLSIAGSEKYSVYQESIKKAVPEFPVSYVLNSAKVKTHVYFHP